MRTHDKRDYLDEVYDALVAMSDDIHETYRDFDIDLDKLIT